MARTAVLLAACLLAAACEGDPTGPGAEAPRRYTVVRIDLPAGAVSAGMSPMAMNEAGQVLLGASYLGREFALWSGGSATIFPAPYVAIATGLNDAGQVVGCTGNVFGEGEQRPLLGEAGRLWYLVGAGLERACARDISNEGIVVGEARQGQGSRAFVLQGGRLTFVSVPGDTAAQGVAVNGRGHVAVNGSRTQVDGLAVSSASRAYLWRGGELVPLGYLEYDAAGPGQVADVSRFSHTAVDLNDRDEVVGSSWGMVCTADLYACHSRSRAFLWRNGKMTDLGWEHDAHNSRAVAINRWGHVLVQVSVGFTPATFLWSDGRLLDLNAAIAETGWTLVNAVDLNDAGQVLGIARRDDATAVVRLDPA